MLLHVKCHMSCVPGAGLLPPSMQHHRPAVFLHTMPTPTHPWGLVACTVQTANNTMLQCTVAALCDDQDNCPAQDVVADVVVAWCPVVRDGPSYQCAAMTPHTGHVVQRMLAACIARRQQLCAAQHPRMLLCLCTPPYRRCGGAGRPRHPPADAQLGCLRAHAGRCQQQSARLRRQRRARKRERRRVPGTWGMCDKPPKYALQVEFSTAVGAALGRPEIVWRGDVLATTRMDGVPTVEAFGPNGAQLQLRVTGALQGVPLEAAMVRSNNSKINSYCRGGGTKIYKEDYYCCR